MNPDIAIVPITRADLDVVVQIEKKSGDAGWSRANFESELISKLARFFVLRQGFNILGYGGYWKVLENAQLTNIVIAPKFRRQGLGKKLLAYLLSHATSQGCQIATLEVRSRNSAALGLYQKMGFTIQTRRPNMYSNPQDDAILMEKKL